MTRAFYPGSFDPLTNGHLDIIKRAAPLFEQLVVGVYAVPQKSLLFSAEERVGLIHQVIADLTNVRAEAYEGLTVDYARRIGARVIVRGLRMNSDFEYEFEMALMNKQLAPELEVVCLMTNLEYQFLSSSLLKEVARLGGDISRLVPATVLAALKKKLLLGSDAKI